ncbi:hypothetical protein ABIA30_000238 [Mycobacterium sp. MAA66]|uniref:DUF3515 domain-containing protein n=1 Tax=Mycobacterium sp. MAA66 TaxID=3156297 RepID=UPI0035124596
MTEPTDGHHHDGGPPRGAIIAAVAVAVAAIVGGLAYVALRQAHPAKPRVPIAAALAPLADSPPCQKLLSALPDTMGEFRRAQALDPVPAGAAAWLGATGTDPVILRCGVERPADFVVGSPLQMVDAVSWLEVRGDGLSTWYAVDRGAPGNYVALTLPQGSGPTPIQTISELLEQIMPVRPLDPAPAR